jgi:hypothetical protein
LDTATTTAEKLRQLPAMASTDKATAGYLLTGNVPAGNAVTDFTAADLDLLGALDPLADLTEVSNGFTRSG